MAVRMNRVRENGERQESVEEVQEPVLLEALDIKGVIFAGTQTVIINETDGVSLYLVMLRHSSRLLPRCLRCYTKTRRASSSTSSSRLTFIKGHFSFHVFMEIIMHVPTRGAFLYRSRLRRASPFLRVSSSLLLLLIASSFLDTDNMILASIM